MNPEILAILFVFLIFLLVGSIGMSIFLLYDIKSGNYRKFLSAADRHDGVADNALNVHKKSRRDESGF
ncbi:MAG: hypothetical protein OXI77_01585 [Chloroflexota bacterium]|nr:hypothetical protein [Chloroflexota bacterium]MDE2910739.1 hypothetical protein [Chloroflexota bacterium]